MIIDTKAAPSSEYSSLFIQMMINRIGFGYAKYKGWANSRKNGIDFLRSARDRMKLYEETKNKEFLVDAANLIMGEYLYPSMEGTYLAVEPESPGMILNNGQRKVFKDE